ncbi:MAG: VCBS repeat-containing protein [Elusimicrobia bacterium]|nr:VCBS repeat-containing protein [Elusimicrobiota bacterium]
MDLAINTSPGETNVIFGPLKKSNLLSVDADFRVTPQIWSVGDFDNNNIDDFLIVESTRTSIVFGKIGLTGSVDLAQTNADVVLNISPTSAIFNVSVGNFNGDNFSDLAITISGYQINQCHLLFGPSPFVKGTYDISSISDQTIIRFPNLLLNKLGFGLYSKDMDGDGKDEIVMNTDYRTTTEDLEAGALQIFKGRSEWDEEWDMGTTPADFTIYGIPESQLGILTRNNYGIGDFTGDGFNEMFLFYARPYPKFEHFFMLDGSFITSSTPAFINIHEGQPGASLTSPILPSNNFTFPLATGDFDGDGRVDLFFNPSPLSALISSDYPTGFPVDLSTSSFKIYAGKEISLGDLNRDGRADLLVSEVGLFETPNGFASSAVFGYYGFRPLRHPQAVVTKGVDARWVDVSLSVDGDPTEMRFTSDVDASLNGQWVPFRPDYRVPLSSSAGPKTVQVTFRNEYKRTSDAVTFQAAVDTPSAGITPVTNRIRPGETAQWDLRAPQPTHVRARILLTTGEPLVEIFNGDGGPGVVPLAWNGRNNAGQPVAPGVYVLVVDMDNQQFKTTVLVR